MSIPNYSKMAQDCFKMIALIINNGEQRYNNKSPRGQSWNFNSQITMPIKHFARQMKTIIQSFEKQSFWRIKSNKRQKGIQQPKIDHHLKLAELQKQLSKTTQLMQEYKYKAQNYYNHWIYQLELINEKNLEVATVNQEKQSLNKQMSLNFIVYKKQLQLNSELSKQCSLNYAAYIKQSQTRKLQLQSFRQQQFEKEKITKLQQQIQKLKHKVTELAQQTIPIYQAYKELQRQNKELKEELASLKNELQQLAFLLEKQLDKQKHCVQPLQKPASIITDAIAQLYQKFILAQAKLKAPLTFSNSSNIIDRLKTAANEHKHFEESQEQKTTLEVSEEKQDIGLLKRQIKIMSNNYAQIYLKDKLNSYENKNQKSYFKEMTNNQINGDRFQLSKRSLRMRPNSSFYEIKKKTEQTNISHKSGVNQNLDEVQLFTQQNFGHFQPSLKIIRWKFSRNESWLTILQKTAELISKQVHLESLLFISTLFCHADQSVTIKLYFNTKQLKKTYQGSKITFSMIRTKINIMNNQKIEQATEHEKQVQDELNWLGKRKVRILSINDLEIEANYDQNLTVIWYQKIIN